MSTDWREKEREFLSGLKPDTGRDLGEWMRVIAAQNLPHRNDIIDWLRQQGFTFARASWLERIHHNAGRPIYLDGAWQQQQQDAMAQSEEMAAEPRLAVAAGGGRVLVAAPAMLATPAASPQSSPTSLETPTASLALVPVPSPVAGEKEALNAADAPATTAAADTAKSPPAPELPATANTSSASPTEIDEVLSKAKAYRPLAAFVLREIEAAVPGATVNSGPSHLLLARDGHTFALLAVSGKDLRLALAPTGTPESAGLQPLKLPVTLTKAAHGLPHMVVLTDARQVDSGFINLVKLAARL